MRNWENQSSWTALFYWYPTYRITSFQEYQDLLSPGCSSTAGPTEGHSGENDRILIDGRSIRECTGKKTHVNLSVSRGTEKEQSISRLDTLIVGEYTGVN